MKMPLKLLCTLTGLGAMFALTAQAASPPCAAGCGAQNVTCLKSARMVRSSCRTGCQTSADVGSCMRGCANTFRSAQTTCHTGQASCVQACNPSSPASGDPSTASCFGACGEDLGTCAHNVAAALKTCVTGCAPGSGRQSCIAGCLSTAQSGAATCASDFTTCVANCGGTTTTTTSPTATTTTMPGPPACGDPTDQACGGTCPTHGDVCRDVSGTCTCVTPH
jgi:hypothetical protein